MIILDELAPGVRGYTVEEGEDIYIPLIISKDKGKGNVGRYLDSLPRDKNIKVPNVMNPLLARMLFRRGYVVIIEEVEELGGESVSVWVLYKEGTK